MSVQFGQYEEHGGEFCLVEASRITVEIDDDGVLAVPVVLTPGVWGVAIDGQLTVMPLSAAYTFTNVRRVPMPLYP